MFLDRNIAAAALVISTAIAVHSEFQCTENGNYLDILSNCTAYFNCRPASENDLHNRTYLRSRFYCQHGQLFSIEEERCLSASNLMCREMVDGTTVSYPVPTIWTTPISSAITFTEPTPTARMKEHTIVESTAATVEGGTIHLKCMKYYTKHVLIQL